MAFFHSVSINLDSRIRASRIILCLCCVLLVGCNLGETRPPTTGTAEQQALAETELADVPPALTTGEWVIRAGKEADGESLPYWRHAALEELLALPADSRPGLVAILANSDPLIQANTAIGLARLGHGDAENLVPILVATIETPNPKLPVGQRMSLRRAATEALGSVPGNLSHTAIEELLDVLGDHKGASRAKYQGELHADLLRALHAHGEPLTLEQGLAALASPERVVRLEALRIWPTELGSALPTEVVAICQDTDFELRAAALHLLAQSQHPEAIAVARRALADNELSVRLEAVEALGELGGDEASELLQSLLTKSQSEHMQAAAVRALTSSGNRQIAFEAVNAEDWQVRQAIAQTLADDANGGAAKVARQLLQDSSQQVTETLMQSLARWPLVDSAPLLLDAMDSKQFAMRKAATEILSERWPAARQFSYQASAELRGEVLAELREQWEESTLAKPPVEQASTTKPPRPVSQHSQDEFTHYLKMLDSEHPSEQLRAGYRASLIAMGDDLIESLEHYAIERQLHVADDIYTQVLPEVEPAFAELIRLQSKNKTDCRRAATALAARIRSGGLSRLAMWRLADLMIHQDDPLVWRSIQEVVATQEDEKVASMQTAGLTHASAEVRRRACDYFAQQSEIAPTEALLAALEDEDSAVVYSALKAIGAQGDAENAIPIVRLTASKDKMLRVAAAVTLVHLGFSEGADALERLALDADARIRRVAAESIGETGDQRFIPILIRLLDDQLGIRRAALASLTMIVGEDIGRGNDPVAPDTDEQIHRWRKWHLLRDVP